MINVLQIFPIKTDDVIAAQNGSAHRVGACYSGLDHSCNKYCDLIGQEEVSISHRGPTNFS